ncbi:hypothetical protein ACFL40_04620, partial [candidate division KSB1 bacterium]
MKKTKKTENKSNIKIAKPSSLYFIYNMFLLLFFIASFFPESFWGINFLSFYPLEIRVLLIAFAYLLIIGKVREGICKAIEKGAQKWNNIDSRFIKYFIIAAAFCIFFLFIWYFPIRSYTRDSGNILFMYMTKEGFWIWRTLQPPHWIEMAFASVFYQFLKTNFDLNIFQTHQILGMMGILFIIPVIFFILNKLNLKSIEKIFIFVFIFIGCPSIIIFFGYVDINLPLY